MLKATHRQQLASRSTATSSKSVKFLQMQRQGPVAQTGTQTVEVTQLQCVDMRCGLRGRPAEKSEAPRVVEACFDRRTDLKEARDQRSHCRCGLVFKHGELRADRPGSFRERDSVVQTTCSMAETWTATADSCGRSSCRGEG